MRSITVLLIVLIATALLAVMYLLFWSDTSSDDKLMPDAEVVSDNGQQTITPFLGESQRDVRSLFSDNTTPQLEEFISTHLNKETYVVSPCKHTDDYLQVSLVFNFAPDAQGLNTIEAAETYLETNYPEIAPGIVSILLPNTPSSDVFVFPFTIVDRDYLIYRAPMVIKGESYDLYHTYIGNTFTFSTSYACVVHVLDDFFHSH